MPCRRALFDTSYRIGRPIWDIPAPPETIDVVEPINVVTNIVAKKQLRSKQLTLPGRRTRQVAPVIVSLGLERLTGE